MSEVIIITGASSGIGQHLADLLLAQGHRIVPVARRVEVIQAYAEEKSWDQERILLHKLDIRLADEWQQVLEATLEKWGRIDVLINNAGVVEPRYIHQATPETIDFIIDTNIKGTMLGTIATSKIMVEQGAGHIIHIGSLGGVLPLPGSSIYSASKAGLRHFSLATTMELRKHGVYVTHIAPDSVDTPQHQTEYEHEEAALSFTSAKPLTVEDLGKATLRALKRKPIEITVPSVSGFFAKLSGLLPGVTRRIMPMLIKQGLANQAKRRA